MRWDDLQLLRLIHELETSGQIGPLLNGHNLIQTAIGGKPIEWDQDPRTFARELILAHRAGYLEWKGRSGPALGWGRLILSPTHIAGSNTSTTSD